MQEREFDFPKLRYKITVRDDGTVLKNCEVMEPRTNGGGYLYVCFGGSKHYLHRLILETFEGPGPEGLEACHTDGDNTNNRLDNLYWGTKKQNGHDRIRHGSTLTGEKNISAILSRAAVRWIYHLLECPARLRPSAAWLGQLLGVSDQTILNIWNGKTWKSAVSDINITKKISHFNRKLEDDEISQIIASTDPVGVLAERFKISQVWVRKLKKGNDHDSK